MKKLIVAAFLILSASVASADATWCQLSFYSPGDLMIPWARSDVYGLRIDLPYGNNNGKLVGVDLGVVGALSEGMTGLQVTGFNLADLAPVKGIRADAPTEIIDQFIQWYRENNRYESGRLRPVWLVRKNCIIPT